MIYAMKWIFCLLFPLLIQNQVPFKPKEEFEFKLDSEFKTKPGVEKSDVTFKDQNFASGKLPHASFTIIPIKLNDDEARVRVENNRGEKMYVRKASIGNEITIEMGFTDDLKDHISVYGFDVIFYSKSGDTSVIKVYVQEDGTVLVNADKKWKF